MFKDIFEAAKNPVNISWDKKGNRWHGFFDVHHQEFEIIINKYYSCKNSYIYQFKFFRDDESKIFNDNKYHFIVYATIKHALHEYVKETKPDILLFAAADESKARISMYRLEASNLASKYHYHDLTKISEDNDIVFGIYKEDKDKKCILELIGE